MAYLKILTGSEKGKKIEIDRDEIIIGRSAENVVPIPEPAISGKHCSISRNGRIFKLKDLDSTNGTRLNGVIIKEYQLSPKDIITVGPVDLQFDGLDAEPAVPQTSTQPAGPQVTVRLSPSVAVTQPQMPSAPVFAAKKDNKWIWITLAVITGLAILSLLVVFIIRLFKAG